jgi:hypothetical protein
VTGSTYPALGQRGQLQRLVRGKWRTIGTFTLTNPKWKSGRLPAGSYRVSIAATVDMLGVTTAAARVR